MGRENDPMCGRCFHVRSEHHDRACLPVLEGGASCACHVWVALDPFKAVQLRLQAADLVAEARLIERSFR